MTRSTAPKSIADVRRYWDDRPCNIRHSTKPVGSREYFDEVEARKYFVEPHIPRFAEFRAVERKAGARGRLRDRHRLDQLRPGRRPADRGRPLRRVAAIARERATVMGVEDRIEFVQANAEELTSAVSGEQYDLIYSFGVIHHTPRPEAALAEMRRLAAPGGTLKVMVYHRHSWKVLWILAARGARSGSGTPTS